MTAQKLNERVASLESGLNSLEKIVNEYANESRQELREVRDGIDDIKKTLSEKNKTNWGQIFSAITIIAMIVGWYVLSIVKPIEKDLENAKTDIAEIRSQVFPNK